MNFGPPEKAVPVASRAGEREVGKPLEKRGGAEGKIGSWWLAMVRKLPCSFCERPGPSSAHHFPSKGAMGLQLDMLSCPACGDGTTGCHGAAQSYQIDAGLQCQAVGRSIADVVLKVLEAIPRSDWRLRVRLAVVQRLTDDGRQQP